MPSRRLLAPVVVLLAAAVLPAPAAAQSSRAADRAERALDEARAIVTGQRPDSGRELTLVLHELANNRHALPAPERREAGEFLRRPADDEDIDQDGIAWYTVAEETPLCSPRFCIHYVATTANAPSMTDGDGDGFPNYVEQMLAVFEEVYARENGPAPGGLGWPKAPNDTPKGGGAQHDVYIANIGADGTYGYVAPDADQDGRSQTSFQVMDDDYVEFAGLTSLKVTAAHEYNHMLQFGINAKVPTWMFEASATWMEDQVYPAINDYFQYVGDWAGALRTTLTLFDAKNGSPTQNHQYGSSLFNYYLSKRFGPAVVRNLWTQSVTGEDALESYERVIPLGQGTSFAQAYGAFTAAIAEWKAGTTRFADGPGYPHAPRTGALAVGGAQVTETLDHASYALRNVTGYATAPAVKLMTTFPADVIGSIALVGGPGLSGPGAISEKIVDVPAGGAASVAFANPAAFSRLTAVVANADKTLAEGGGWAADDMPITARVVPAGLASIGAGVLSFKAAPGAANRVTISQPTTTSYRITDTASPLVPGAGCVANTANQVTCTSTTLTSISVNAGNGDDVVTSSSAKPTTVFGGDGSDTLTSGAGNDTFDGGAGNDTFNGNAGGDIMTGGLGSDTATYASRAAAVTVKLDGLRNDGSSFDAADVAQRDNVKTDVENIAGGAGGDTLRAAAATAVVNTITGNGGADIIRTYDGTATVDRVLCGAGVDKYDIDDSDAQIGCETAVEIP